MLSDSGGMPSAVQGPGQTQGSDWVHGSGQGQVAAEVAGEPLAWLMPSDSIEAGSESDEQPVLAALASLSPATLPIGNLVAVLGLAPKSNSHMKFRSAGLRTLKVPLECERVWGGVASSSRQAARARIGAIAKRNPSGDTCCHAALDPHHAQDWRVAAVIVSAGASRALLLQHLQALHLSLTLRAPHQARRPWTTRLVAPLLPSAAQSAVRLQGGRWLLQVPNVSMQSLSLCRYRSSLSVKELQIQLGMLPVLGAHPSSYAS